MPKDIEFVLKDFVHHVINLKAEDDPGGTGFDREFRILREEQAQNKTEERFATEDGKKEENLRKNRYKDILPRDDRRVMLTEIEGEKGSDYINASFIDDVYGERGYIAAQGPMPHTVNDFWRMLWQYRTEIVFMACRLKEDGRPKCEKYWPNSEESTVFGEITVYAESEEMIQQDFFKRQLRAEKDGESHMLTQFHYVGWPDHNTPSSPDVLRMMVEDVRNFRRHPEIPMVVHCSAGCGRTGTICAIDYAWTLLDKGMITEGFSMFEIIKCMREQRVSMVQTPDQYEYIHMVMKALCNEWMVSFTDHDYENIIIPRPSSENEEDVDETYANMEFMDDKDGDTTEELSVEVVTISKAQKETDKQRATSVALPVADSILQTTAKTEVAVVAEDKSKRPEPDQKRPESNQKPPEPDRKAPEPDQKPPEPYQKALEPNQKPQASGKVLSTASTHQPPTMVVANLSNTEAGEYVEVSPSATVSCSSNLAGQKMSSSSDVMKISSVSTSSSENRKISASNSAAADAQRKASTSSASSNPEMHTTVINVSAPINVGITHTKQRAPKPPNQAVVKPIVVSQPLEQQQQQQVTRNDVMAEMVKIKPTPTPDPQKSELQTSSSQKPSSPNAASDEVAPDLPSRNYRPDEIASLPNSPTSPTAPQEPRPAPTIPITTHKAPTSSHIPPQPPSNPPPSKNRDQLPQPVPLKQEWPTKKSPHRVDPNHQSEEKPKGMVSVYVDPQRFRNDVQQNTRTVSHAGPVVVQLPNSQSVAAHRTQPVTGTRVEHFKGPAPRKVQVGTPMMMKQSAPAMATPVLHQGTHGGKIIYLTERPQRVRGPKDMPPGWMMNSKHHRPPFL